MLEEIKKTSSIIVFILCFGCFNCPIQAASFDDSSEAEINVERIGLSLGKVKSQAPLIHNITNFVTMDFVANSLLAIGASPVMAHAPEEIEEMVNIAGALVLNIGTLDRGWIENMTLALESAQAKKKPIILDPVGAGATTYRTSIAKRFIHQKLTAIRGNASEISALIEGEKGQTKGVDSTMESIDVVEKAVLLAKDSGSIIIVSGATDIITDGNSVYKVNNGHPLMKRVTGMGCVATALIGSFLAAEKEDPLVACVSAMVVMGIVGEKAALQSDKPGSFKQFFLDQLMDLNSTDIIAMARIERHKLA